MSSGSHARHCDPRPGLPVRLRTLLRNLIGEPVGTRIEQLRTDSLARNSAMIAAATGATSVLGYGYWVFAARLFPAASVGIASAVVSAMALVSMVAILGGQSGLVERLPKRAGAREWSVTVSALLLMGTALSVAGSLLTVLAIPLLDSHSQLFAEPLMPAMFAVAVVATTASTLCDYAWIAQRRAGLMLGFNLLFAIGKIGLLLGLSRVTDDALAVTASWTVAAVAATAGSLLMMRRLCGFRLAVRGTWAEVMLLRRSLVGHHVINLAIVAPVLVLPVLAATRISPADAAYLYAAWRIGGFFVLVASAVGSALFAEGSHDAASLGAKTRSSVRLLVPVLGLMTLTMVAFRGEILGIFGDDYRRAASTALLLLTAAAIPEATLSIGSAVLRVQGRLRSAAAVLTATALTEIVVAGLVMPAYGVTGSAVTALACQTAGAAVLLLLLARRPAAAPAVPPSSVPAVPLFSVPAVPPGVVEPVPVPIPQAPERLTLMSLIDTPYLQVAPEPLRATVHGARRDLDAAGPTVSVVIPAMNEARNLPWLAARMPGNVHEIILVDGRSQDDTIAVARHLWPQVRVVKQHRRGKGNALACGFAAVTGDITVMIDADGSMDPGEIPAFVDALTGGADYAKGSRFVEGGGSTDITRIRALGNRFLNGVTNLIYGAAYTDLCYGYNAFWTGVARSFELDPGSPADDPQAKLWGDGFEIETLINIRVRLQGHTIAEVASFESDRLHGASNLNAVSDGLRVLRTIGTESRRRRRLALRSPARGAGAPAASAAHPVWEPAAGVREVSLIDLGFACEPVESGTRAGRAGADTGGIRR